MKKLFQIAHLEKVKRIIMIYLYLTSKNFKKINTAFIRAFIWNEANLSQL